MEDVAELPVVGKRQRKETATQQAIAYLEGDDSFRNQVVLQKIAAALVEMAAEVRQLREDNKKLHEEIRLMTNQQIQFQPQQAERTLPHQQLEQKPSYASVVLQQGNGRPTVAIHNPAVGAKRKIVGSRQDSVKVVQPSSKIFEQKEVPENNTLAKQMTLPERKEPRELKVLPIKIDRVMPRTKCPAKQWREVLRERNIRPFSIYFPHLTAVEILIAAEDEGKMHQLLAELQKTPVNADPYVRRDGKEDPLPDEVIQKIVEQRIQMLKYETGMTGIRYLQQIIERGINMITNRLTRPVITTNYQATLSNLHLKPL